MTPNQLTQVTWLYLLQFSITTASQSRLDRMNSHIPDEQRLYNDLMYNYEPNVRPVVNASKAIIVHFRISFNQIVELDERTQVLTTSVFMDQEWEDENLKWNMDAYNGIRTLRVPANQVWLPDTFIFNNADDGSTGFMQGVYVLLNSTGRVLWPVPVKLKSSCKVDITYFPFDDQRCILRFGSWIYSGEWMDFESSIDQVDLTNYIDNSEWELLSVFFEKGVREYVCCPDVHPDLTYTLHMRRRTFYYIFNVIVPCVMLSVLTLLTFWLPATSGEKISLGLSVFLAFSMFMLLIAEEVPATSESVPLIGIYLTTVMTMTSVSVIMAVMVINLYNRGSKAHKAPNWLKVVVLKWICKLMRMSHDIERLAQSIRLDDDEEKKYKCQEHNPSKSGTVTPCPYDNIVRCVQMDGVAPKTISPSDSELGDLSKRFSVIEQTACNARQRHGSLVQHMAGDNGTHLLPSSEGQQLSPSHMVYDNGFTPSSPSPRKDYASMPSSSGLTSTNTEVRPAQLTSGIDSASTDVEEDEPVWVPRDMGNKRPLLPKNSNNAKSGIVRPERPVKPIQVNFTSDSCQSEEDKSDLLEKTPSRTKSFMKRLSLLRRKNRNQLSREAMRNQRKQDTIANLVIKNCKKERALVNRREMVVEWHTIASVIDRLLFWVFFTATALCYFIILFLIPYTKPPFPEDVTSPHFVRKGS